MSRQSSAHHTRLQIDGSALNCFVWLMFSLSLFLWTLFLVAAGDTGFSDQWLASDSGSASCSIESDPDAHPSESPVSFAQTETMDTGSRYHPTTTPPVRPLWSSSVTCHESPRGLSFATCVYRDLLLHDNTIYYVDVTDGVSHDRSVRMVKLSVDDWILDDSHLWQPIVLRCVNKILCFARPSL